MKSVIGISLRITNAEKYVEKRDSISHDWPILLQDLGFTPLLIPNTISDVTTYLDEMKISGLILSGGDNIGDDKLRDKTETTILDYAISHNVPFIGVCIGAQLLAHCSGRKLIAMNSCEAALSKAEVGSSNTINLGRKTKARAIQMRWRCPPERLIPFSPIQV